MEQVKINFNNIIGEFKPMHAVGQPPMLCASSTYFHYLTEAGVPYSRLHDVGGWMGGGLYVDIPNIFRDFDKNENDPENYDFAFTDRIIKGLIEANCEPYFRLGVTIENLHMVKAYRIFPPKDFSKWARICEHIIRHYTEGWANGFNYRITYWEIWNEPDDCFSDEWAAMWKGTPEEFFELYSVTARHIKSCFGDKIKIGGYGSCGVYEYRKDKDLLSIAPDGLYEFTIDFMHRFLKYQKQTNAPLDFFSWHVYDNCHPSTKEDFLVIKEHAQYIRKVLDKYGFTSTEHHLNEWNLWTQKKYRDSFMGSAKTLAFMLMMQNTSTDVMCFYDAGIGLSDYRALISADSGLPYKAYYSFMMFNGLYQLKNQVMCECADEHIFACSGINGKKAEIVIANTNDYEAEIELDMNFEYTDALIIRLDEDRRYTLTGEKLTKTVKVPSYGCVEIKLFNLK